MTAAKILEDDDEGGREERSFRTWINSLKLEGVKKLITYMKNAEALFYY